MLDGKDRIYVMDFGIARSLETPGMTQTGALMGTPEYMSPEQAKGIKVDARSDLFALGIIFCEMLTGILSQLLLPNGLDLPASTYFSVLRYESNALG
jgi:eukaryotic-like serine/threonine-protein kinase